MYRLLRSPAINQWRRPFGGIVVVALCVLIAPLVAAQDSNVAVDEIKRIWRERQEKVRTARFSLDCKETIHKGSADVGPIQLRKRQHGQDNQPNPPRDYAVEGTAQVVFDGGKLHHSYEIPVWDPKKRGLYQDHYEDVFDGQTFKSLQTPASGEHDYPLGMIIKADKSRSAGHFSIVPLFIALRGEHDQFVRDLKHQYVPARKVTVASRPCIELVSESRVDDRRELLYLDAERGYLVIRKLIVERGTPTWQLDIAYAPDPVVGWVPKSWSYVIRTLNPNQVYQSGTRVVSNYELNANLAASEFDIRFPVGARILDQSSGKEVQYVIQDDGSKGSEIPSKANPTYQQLKVAKSSTTRSAVLVASALIFIVCLGCLSWLRWRRRRARQRPTVPDGPLPSTNSESM